jgi:cellobiose-specific phosphotransferase system component IIA
VQLLDEAYRAIAEAHEISAHLIFATADDDAAAPTARTDE